MRKWLARCYSFCAPRQLEKVKLKEFLLNVDVYMNTYLTYRTLDDTLIKHVNEEEIEL